MGWLRLTAVTAAQVDKLTRRHPMRQLKSLGGRYTKPSRVNPWQVPPPPDYSTPAAITARCREAGGWTSKDGGSMSVVNTWLRASWVAEKDMTVVRAYHAFRKATGAWVDPDPLMPPPARGKVGRRSAKLASARAKLAKQGVVKK